MNNVNDARDAALAIGRLTHHHPNLNDDPYPIDTIVKLPVVTPDGGANIVSSLLTNGMHAPCIDLDVPAMLLPSSTPGHSHLYINTEVAWSPYLRLLTALGDAGIVEPGFVAHSERRGHTSVRLPGVLKRRR